jgi:hypothetical protein
MPDYLVYWKRFWKDGGHEAPNLDYFWHTSWKPLPYQVQPNDRLWVLTTGGRRRPTEWRLLQRLSVQNIVPTPRGAYAFKIIGDDKKSQTFDFENERDIAALLRRLKFRSGRRITGKGLDIGVSLRLPRALAGSDSVLLDHYCRTLSYYDPARSPSGELQERVKAGAGFGDPVLNRKVEVAAVRHVRQHYKARGWQVESVEREKIGYDLRCLKGDSCEHVEVKGIRGQGTEFFITKNEVSRAEQDPYFVLFTVTSALLKPRKTRYYSGKELLKEFELVPLVYRAQPT